MILAVPDEAGGIPPDVIVTSEVVRLAVLDPEDEPVDVELVKVFCEGAGGIPPDVIVPVLATLELSTPVEKGTL